MAAMPGGFLDGPVQALALRNTPASVGFEFSCIEVTDRLLEQLSDQDFVFLHAR